MTTETARTHTMVSYKTLLHEDGTPRLVVTVRGTGVPLALDEADAALAAHQDALVQARAIAKLRSIVLPPDHEAVQELLTLARLVVTADDAVERSGGEGDYDELCNARDERVHELRLAFARFDGEPIDESEGG